MKWLSALLALASVLSAAQSQQSPVRDQARIVYSGTATLSGVVVLDDEKRPPLRRATVTLVRQGVEDLRTTSTDEAGRYSFGGLPAGSYTLSATKGGHITMSYGAPKPAMPGRTIVLTEGQTYSATPIAVMRGAVIAGRLLDRSGRPVPSIAIEAVQFVTIGSERRRRQTSGQTPFATTNEHGEYRIFGLMPGAYLVLANAPFSGRETEVTADEIAWARKPEGPAPRQARPFSHASSLFPGVADVAAATPIVLSRGEERLGVEFALQYAPVARITGIVVGLDGAPVPNVAVFRSQKRRDEFLVAYSDTARTNAEGRFTMMSVGPGDHTLFVRGGRGGGPTTENSLWGLADVSVAGADVPDITIRLQQGMSLSGQIVVAGAGQDTRPPDLGRLRVQLLPAIPTGALPIGVTATADPDGRFRIEGVVPGRYLFTTTLPPAPAAEPWLLRSALLTGKDVVDEAFEVRPNEDVNGLIVSITKARTHLSGVLTDGNGRPASELYVFVFPTVTAQWVTGSRRIASTRAREDGSYVIENLPAGEYYLCGLTEVDATLRYEPSYLQELVKASIKLQLGDGEKKVQHLRVGGGGNRPEPH